MRKIIMCMMLLTATCASAQDVITKKDFSKITAQVLEVGISDVKYKKFSNLDGPTYSISIKDIHSIKYENGEIENFSDRQNETEQQSLYLQQQQQNSYMQQQMRTSNLMKRDDLLASAHAWHAASQVWFWVGFVGTLASVWAVYDEENQTPAYIVAGGGALVTVAGYAILQSISNKKEKAAKWVSSNHLYKKDFDLGNTRLSAGVDHLHDRLNNEHALGIGLSLNF